MGTSLSIDIAAGAHRHSRQRSGDFMSTSLSIDEAALAKAWHAYIHEPHRTLVEIARTELGLGRAAFAHRRAAWRWPKRHIAVAAARAEVSRRLPGLDPALSAAVPLALVAQDTQPDGIADFGAVARSLRILLLRQLQGLEPEPGDLDRTARTLQTIPKTVDAIQALERLQGPADASSDDAGANDPDEPPPRSIEELRQELAGHLDRLAQEEALERGFGFDDADGVGAPA
jgi:hypothetical protein